MHVVYVIQHDSGELYIGITTNLKQRLGSHNSKNNKSTVRKMGKWHLIYAEAYRSKADATNRESKLKQHSSSKHELSV